ncbi:GntR family transcriptional regulator [Micromonospora wenchangensis]|uniref:GntR family transcriptional regulator n=1 Tax=Micromonospora wenchangensis TaxID=1185415 RepID=UPI003D765B20
MPTPHYGQPRYRTIADEIRQRIESGEIPPGSLLPTESNLTVEFRASRGTVRQAIAALRSENLVVTEHGRGTYADPSRGRTGIGGAIEMETRQRPVAADPELAAIFAVETGTTLLEQQDIKRAGGAAKAVVRTYRLPESK